MEAEQSISDLVNQQWEEPPLNMVLSNHAVHVWLVRLEQFAEQLPQLQSLLSEDEQTRAQRFHFEQHRNRFVACRGWLRSLLSRYLKISPTHIQFEYGQWGKPALHPAIAPPLSFNLSHTHDLALYAFAEQGQIGIDVERIRPLTDIQKLVNQCFSDQEQAAFATLSAEQQAIAFFRAWTCKEAYLKAIGCGLSQSLNQIEVTLLPQKSPQLLSINGNTQIVEPWSLHLLHPHPDYAAALMVEGTPSQIQLFQYSGQFCWKD